MKEADRLTFEIESLRGHLRSQGLPDLPLSVPAGPFLAAPIQHIGQRVGNVYLAKQERGGEFSAEDEETLVMFAAQAALVISNARRLRDERRASLELGLGLAELLDAGQFVVQEPPYQQVQLPGAGHVHPQRHVAVSESSNTMLSLG